MKRENKAKENIERGDTSMDSSLSLDVHNVSFLSRSILIDIHTQVCALFDPKTGEDDEMVRFKRMLKTFLAAEK